MEMWHLRPVHWAQDLEKLLGIDTGFTTDRIYRVLQEDSAFRLVEEPVSPPVHKRFPDPVGEPDRLHHAVLAEAEGGPIGYVTVRYEEWNRRAVIWGLYVAPEWRRRGVGRALVETVEAFAAAAGGRCLWLETSNLDYPAIRFYRRLGFRWCGLDTSLYDPAGPAGGEVALYFARDLGA